MDVNAYIMLSLKIGLPSSDCLDLDQNLLIEFTINWPCSKSSQQPLGWFISWGSWHAFMWLITKLSTEQVVWFEASNIQAKLHAGSCNSLMPPPGPSYEKIWKVHDARFDDDLDLHQ